MLDSAVEQALRLDAACLCVNLFLLPDQPEVHAACLENILKLKPEADRYGMPLMIEPLVMKGGESGGYMVDGDLTKIKALVRQAAELGAEADPCDDPAQYYEVVEVAGRVPVLVRGGGKVSDGEIFRRTHMLMQQGVRGIVYGRNVVHHNDPALVTRALMAIVHNGVTADQAVAMMRGGRARTRFASASSGSG